jgi:hypothetical protein
MWFTFVHVTKYRYWYDAEFWQLLELLMYVLMSDLGGVWFLGTNV